MQYVPLTKSSPLTKDLQDCLDDYRKTRAFNPKAYLDKKTKAVVDYFSEHGLKGAVIGMSGGVDSATVLGILLHVQSQHPDILQKIQPVSLPTYVQAVGQSGAVHRAVDLCEMWKIDCPVINLAAAMDAICEQVKDNTDHDVTPWAVGQLTSYIRTPALYFMSSVLTANKIPTIIAGTTNRDEGSYLGYVGKASDGMVDVQLISDLHKSEVYKLAKYLNVSEEILTAVPSGEMFDGRVDEEVFGAPYDFVELYLNYLCHPSFDSSKWNQESIVQFKTFAKNLEALHQYNFHKYIVGSPAVHLNVMESAVPGGWR